MDYWYVIGLSNLLLTCFADRLASLIIWAFGFSMNSQFFDTYYPTYFVICP